MRHSVPPQDIDMMNFLKESGYKFIVVLTKSDKLNKTEYKKRMEEIGRELDSFGDVCVIPFSAVNGEGVQRISEEIERAAGG